MKLAKSFFFILLTGMGLWSCSGQQDRFSVQGEFTNLAEAELHFWTLDGGRGQVDTVMVHGGKFKYESPQEQPGWYTLQFPNGSEQVIFAEPGEDVEISADATHLKNMKIKGGKANEQMTAFRKQTQDMIQDQDIAFQARAFILAAPQSIVSVYLFFKYFVQREGVSYADWKDLFTAVWAEHPDNRQLQNLNASIQRAEKAQVGTKAPAFQVRGENGEKISLASYKGKTLLLCFWANWAPESRDEIAQLHAKAKLWHEPVSILTVSLDLQRMMWRNLVRMDSLPGKHSCDLQAWESPVVQDYGVYELPTYFLIDPDGNISARESSLELITENF